MTSKLVFEFPDDNARDCFLAWFSDGGGEHSFMDGDADAAEDTDRPEIVEFSFERAFAAHGYDPEKHGPDCVVVAHYKK